MQHSDNARKFWNDNAEKSYFGWNEYNIREKQVQPDFEDALKWIREKSDRVLDFGCGLGIMCIRLAALGAEKCLGIDISDRFVHFAKILANSNALSENIDFLQGTESALRDITANMFNGGVLFNVLDNLTQETSDIVLKEFARILPSESRLVIKLNPFQTREQLQEKYTEIEADTFQGSNGLLIRYVENDKFSAELSSNFDVFRFLECEKNKQRLFYCVRK